MQFTTLALAGHTVDFLRSRRALRAANATSDTIDLLGDAMRAEMVAGAALGGNSLPKRAVPATSHALARVCRTGARLGNVLKNASFDADAPTSNSWVNYIHGRLKSRIFSGSAISAATLHAPPFAFQTRRYAEVKPLCPPVLTSSNKMCAGPYSYADGGEPLQLTVAPLEMTQP